MGVTDYPLQVIKDLKDLGDYLSTLIKDSPVNNYIVIDFLANEDIFDITFKRFLKEYYFYIQDYVAYESGIKYSIIYYPINDRENEEGDFELEIEEVKKHLHDWLLIVENIHSLVKLLKDSKKNIFSDEDLSFFNQYTDNIKLKNFQFLKNIELNNLSNKKEIYILGENGDGKTVLLQALLLAFKEHFAEGMAKKSLVGEFLDFEKDFKKASYEVELEDKTILSKTNQSYHSNVYAYGTNRGNILSETEDEYGFMTLFSPRYHLRNPVDWLVDLRGKELELKSKAKEENKDTENKKTQNILTLETAKSLLEDIINSSENPKDIHIEVDLSTKEKVVFKERNTKIKFEHLSEGYRSVFIWVADLVSRLAESQPNVKQIQDFKGIVLVDEINLHLHPKWEIQIVQKLRLWFPNIQFFFTTHSPICILGASEDAVFYRLYKENGVAQLSEQIEYSQIKEMTANQVVTSMLFDLETPFMKHTDSSEIDTSDDYLYNRIHKKISERLEKRKKEGEVYFSDEEINAMIDEALNDEIE